MQTTTLKNSEGARDAQVVRIWRPPVGIRPDRRRIEPSAAVYRSPSKWTVVAAFLLAVVLVAGGCRVGLDAAGKTAGEVVEFAERLILRIRERPECVRKNAHPKEEPHHNDGAPLSRRADWK